MMFVARGLRKRSGRNAYPNDLHCLTQAHLLAKQPPLYITNVTEAERALEGSGCSSCVGRELVEFYK